MQTTGVVRRAGLLKRRGIVAGVAALVGAGLAKLGGPAQVSASHGPADAVNALHVSANNAANGRTYLSVSRDTPVPGLLVAMTIGGATVGPSRLDKLDAIHGTTLTSGAAGVVGEGDIGALGLTVAGAGVRGECGTSLGSIGSGVVGVAAGCEMGNGSNVGVGGSGRGATSPAGKTGVLGLTDNGIAVQGWAKAGGIGIQGSANNGNGPDFGGNGIGVEGRSGAGTGVRGQSTTGIGVAGFSIDQIGVRGDSTHNYGVYGSSSVTGPRGEATGAGVGFVGVALNPEAGGLAGYFLGPVHVQGSFTVGGGAKSAVVRHPDGSHRRVYCQESPEAWFEDFGTATLTNGRAVVDLDPDFNAVVRGDDYLVFPVPEGDCKGLFVSRKGPHRFVVEELQGGTSTLPFSYRVVSRRREAVGGRLEKVEIEAPPTPKSPPQKVGPNGRLLDA